MKVIGLRIRLTADGKELKGEIANASKSVQQLGRDAKEAGGKSERGAIGVGKLGREAKKTALKTKKLTGSLAEETRVANRASRSMKDFAGTLAVVQGPLGPLAGRVGALGAVFGRVSGMALAATAGVTAFSVVMSKSIGAAANYNSQMNRLRALIRGTGGAAGLTAQEIDAFSISLGENTLTSATAVRDAAGMLLSFRSISGSQFKETLSLSQDLAATMRTDLRGAAVQLAKALEQPEIGLTMLRRAGVSFTKQQKDQIITLAKSGRQFEAQQLILDSVRKTVGGAGVGEASGLIGAVDTLGERWSNLLITIGNSSGVLKPLTKAVTLLSENLRSIATGALLAAKLAAIGFAGKMALVALETNAVTFSLAGLRAASLGLFMLYKTGGIKSVLAAPFISMTAATKTAFAGVSKLRIATSALFAAYAGWQIGSYLSDQFAIVRQSGVALVAGLVKGWTYTKSAFELMGAGISIAWDTMIAGMKHALGSFLDLTSRAIDKLPFMDGVAASVKGYATQLQHAQGPLETFAAAQKRINDERDRTISQQDKILSAMFADAGKSKSAPTTPTQPTTGGGNTPSSPNASVGDPTKKLLSSAGSFTSQLSNKYKSSFERIAEKYSAMFDKLEALGKPGEKKLEALQTAYGQFVEQNWQKQEEKRKSILQRGVDAIAESLLSEDDRRKQALDNRVAMIQQAQDDGLISEQRGLELRNQLHADYDQQLADQKLQAMQDFEQNATDLKAQFAQIASSNQLVNLKSLQKNLIAFGKSAQKIDKTTFQGKLQIASSGLKMVSGLMASHNRKAFEIGKAASIAQATVDGISAVMSTFKNMGGFPYGIIPAAIMGGIAATNVAKIASTKFGGGASSTASTGGAGGIPSVTGNASNVVPLNPSTGIPQHAAAAPAVKFQLHVTGDPSQMTEEAKRLLADEMTTRIAQNLANGHGGGLRAAA
jgi:hypothetical protein